MYIRIYYISTATIKCSHKIKKQSLLGFHGNEDYILKHVTVYHLMWLIEQERKLKCAAEC